jgi:hypothetical protein
MYKTISNNLMKLGGSPGNVPQERMFHKNGTISGQTG